MGTMQVLAQLVTDIPYSFSKNSYLAFFFVDLKGVFDMVDLNILTDIVKEYEYLECCFEKQTPLEWEYRPF